MTAPRIDTWTGDQNSPKHTTTVTALGTVDAITFMIAEGCSMAIVVNQLVKSYRIHHKEAGLRESLRNLFARRYQTVEAVGGISFELA